MHITAVCAPGSIKRLLSPLERRRYPDQPYSLMPFCIECGEGYYQPEHNQAECLQCPTDHTSLIGSKAITDCYLPELHKSCTQKQNLCKNQGSCIASSDKTSYCKCKFGFYGWRCEHQINPCLSGPCYNNGKCQPFANQYQCKCAKEFQGHNCEIPVPKCQLNFCQNNGKCFDLANGEAQCACKTGFAGKQCEIKHDHCADLSCKNGNCIYSVNGPKCKCHSGYMGRRCHLKPCDYMPCPKTMECKNTMSKETSLSSFKCECNRSFTGEDCTIKINPCLSDPCQNNGICESVKTPKSLAEFSCTCPQYFFGALCETFISPDFEMHFDEPRIGNYVEITGPTLDLQEVYLKMVFSML